MRFFSNLVMFLMVVLLAACGGGGGSPGLSSAGSSTVLFSSAPTSVTLTSGTQVSYPITGGAQPYAVTTDSPALVSALIVDSNLSISALGGGVANVFVTDAKGAKLSIAVTIPQKGALFTTAPSAGLTLAVGSSNTFTVGGGTAPYTVVSSNVAIASAAIANGTGLTINGHAAGGATIDVRDAVGGMATVSVTVSSVPTVVMFTTAPSTVNIGMGATGNYTITGGLPPYTATSDDNSVVRAAVSGSNLSVSAVGGGKANVVIKDSQGTSTITVAVSVGSSTKLFINAPSAVTVAAGSSATYLITGGAAPYTVVSGDARIANGGIVGTALTVSALAIGSTGLQITDSAGAVIVLTVTVTSGSTAVVSQDPVLKSATLLEGTVSTSSIGASTVLSVKLTDPSGVGIPNQVIDVTGDLTQVKFPEGASALTNSQGIATVKVDRASLQAAGAGSLTVNYSYKPGAISAYPNGSAPPSTAKVITTYVGYQLSAANVTLTNLDVGAATLAAYGTRQISVQTNVNGAAPSGSPVQVNFTTSCGQMTPASVTTNSSGVAVSSYTATDVVGSPISTLGCSGKTVEIAASTIGATVVTKSISVVAAPATNLSFVSATPQRIYLDGSGGATQSIVEFKLVNARGEPILGQDINLTLKTTNGGIPKASFGTVGNLSLVKGTTDANGKVSVPVFSGTVPTNVLVNAALVTNSAVQTDSAALTIASGRPAQARVSLSIAERAIRGFNFDGGETTVTLSLADRQGNPVPDGTAVNFVTEGGVMIPPVCTTGGVPGNSQCTVKIRTQNPRPDNGLVTILAYAAGEEDFVDANGNNVFDCGESFTDLGLAYRDDTATNLGVPNAFVDGEFSVPRNASAGVCGSGSRPTPLAGDGVWGAADVRAQTVLVFSTDAVQFVNAVVSTGSVRVTVQDANGVRANSIPTNSKIEVSVKDNSSGTGSKGCTVAGQSVETVPQSLDPLAFLVTLSGCESTDAVTIKVTPPAPSSGVWAATYTIP